MRRLASFQALVFLVLASCQTTGDGMTPTDYLYAAKGVYTVSVETMKTLGDAGLIDLEAAEQFEVVRAKADALLTAAQEAIDSGADFSFTDLNATIRSLQDIVVIISKGVRDGTG